MLGKGWSKDGRSQANPTLAPGERYEGWEKGDRRMGEARQSPPLPQAMGMKDGERVDQGWESSYIFQTQFPVHFLEEFACFLPIDHEVSV